MNKIRVLCVDDSALMRQLMTEIVNSHPDMEMVAVAQAPPGRTGSDQKIQSTGIDVRCGNAAHGWPRLFRETDAPAPDAGGDGLLPYR